MKSLAFILIAGLTVVLSAGGRSRLWGLGNILKEQPVAREVDDEASPKPAWKPEIAMDLPRTVEACAYYVDYKKSFVVFSHGTCVLLPEASVHAEEDARRILKTVSRYHPDFHAHKMNDGHFLVNFSQPACIIVFRDEYEKNRDLIEKNHLGGLVGAEVLVDDQGQPNKFDERLKVGLYGRARMFLDAEDPVIVKIWRPQASAALEPPPASPPGVEDGGEDELDKGSFQ